MNGTAFAAFTRPPAPKRQCKVCDILGKLDPQTSVAARGALADDMRTWPHTAIADVFEGLGHPVSDHSVRAHRLRCS